MSDDNDDIPGEALQEAGEVEALAAANVSASPSDVRADLHKAAAQLERAERRVQLANSSLQQAKLADERNMKEVAAAEAKLAASQAKLAKLRAQAEAAAQQAATAVEAEKASAARLERATAAGKEVAQAAARARLDVDAGAAHRREAEEAAMKSVEEAEELARAREVVRADTAQRLYQAQSSVSEAKAEAKEVQRRAEHDRLALVKLQRELELTVQQIAELRQQAEAAEAVLEEAGETLGDAETKLVQRFQERLASMEQQLAVVDASVDDTDKCGASDAASVVGSEAPAGPESDKDFRKRMSLIGKGVSSDKAKEMVQAEALEEAKNSGTTKHVVPVQQLQRKEDVPCCCGCSALFCCGLWCGIATGGVTAAIAALAATGVTVSAAVATLSGVGTCMGGGLQTGYHAAAHTATSISASI